MENLDVFVLALFCFILGATAVGLVVYLRNNKVKTPPGKGETDPDLEELARVWRDGKSGRMVIGLDEQTYTTASALSVKQRQQMARTADWLQNWLADAGSEPAPQSPETAKSTPPVPPVAVKEQGQPAPSTAAPAVQPVPARPLEALNRVFSPSPPQAQPKFKSIAAQINEILQSRLPGSPYEAVGIDLIETPDQGVVVRVGEEEFAGVDAVPDPGVRAMIKTAVAEWEEKTRGGIR